MSPYQRSDLPVTETLRDLLAALPLWREDRARHAFLELALQSYPAISDFQHGGKPLTVASELATKLHQKGYAALPGGEHPVCALIREIRTQREALIRRHEVLRDAARWGRARAPGRTARY
jgi:hypothetical protein